MSESAWLIWEAGGPAPTVRRPKPVPSPVQARKPSPKPQPAYLTPYEAAAACRTHPHTIYRACDRGDLAHTRVGRSIRIDPRDLDRWLRGEQG